MGSYSSSTSVSTNVDKRMVVDAGATGITADNSTVQVLDNGAIEKAFSFANLNTKQLGESFEDLLGFAKDAMNMTQDNAKVAEMATQEVAKAYEGAAAAASGQKIILYGVLVLAGLWLLKRKGGA